MLNKALRQTIFVGLIMLILAITTAILKYIQNERLFTGFHIRHVLLATIVSFAVIIPTAVVMRNTRRKRTHDKFAYVYR